MTIEEIQSDWAKNQKNYEKFETHLRKNLDLIIAELGIQARVVSRTKKIGSIIKKLYKKHGTAKYSDYLELKDIVGARVICRFRSDTYRVGEEIRKKFSEEHFEDKSNILKHDQVGYKSLHFDIKLKSEKTPRRLFSLVRTFTAEIQVRTLCEDTWAEIYHDIGYKPLNQLPKEVNRQLYCLAGLLEVADDCFSNLNNQILSSPTLDEDSILRLLEIPFIKYIDQHFDRELSDKNLQILLKVHNFGNFSNFEKEISDFIDEKRNDMIEIVEEKKQQADYLPYLSQPEIFLIFYFIQNNLHSLNKIWTTYLNIEDLEDLCLLWRKPLVDYDPD
jgi:ppGpp synthetase/RelA/SpoT-type nucleotidyltranferase